MLWVGFEPTIPAFERAKIGHALDGAATVIGFVAFMYIYYSCSLTTEITAHCTLYVIAKLTMLQQYM
jgi:hypothetical protein